MRTHTKIVFLLFGACLLAGAVFWAVFPWKDILTRKLQTVLAEKGFSGAALTLSDLGPYHATLENVKIGDEKTPLILKNIILGYTPLSLWQGHVRSVSVSGLALEVAQKEGIWTISGLPAPKTEEEGVSFPVTSAQIAALPIDHLALDDSHIRMMTDAGNFFVPVKFLWRKTPAPELSLHAENLVFDGQALKVHAGGVEADVKFNAAEQMWRGSWHIKDVQLEAEGSAVPAMDIAGDFILHGQTLSMTGHLESKDHTYKAEFILKSPLDGSENSILTLVNGHMPWNEGTLALKDVHIPLAGKAPITLDVQVSQVSVDALMRALTDKKILATGRVSGMLPLIIERDGTVSFGQGELKAEGPGIIALPPELVPGENEQIVLTREILKNFHYDGLLVSIASDDAHNISALMTLDGRNPGVMNGRAVKLNIRLSGDLLDLFQQYATMLGSPQKMLGQDQE